MRLTNFKISCLTLLMTLWSTQILANDYDSAKSAFDEGNTQQAIEIWTQLAEQGDMKAQFALGAVYASGAENLTADDVESIKWFRMAAEQGHVIAQYNLGNAYERGRGVEQSNEEAVKWWQKASEKNHAPSQFNLGSHYFFGRGVEQDTKQAEQLWYKSALQNHSPSQFNLATLYKYGPDDIRNNQKAMHWYRIAARNGHQGAQRILLNDATDTGEQNFPQTADNNDADKKANNEDITALQDKQNTQKSKQEKQDVRQIASQAPKSLPEPTIVSDQKIDPKKIEAKPVDINIVGKPREISSAKDVSPQTADIKTNNASEDLEKQAATEKAAAEQAAVQNASTASNKSTQQNGLNFNITHRESWINQQDSKNYTLQLAAFQSEKQVIEFLRQHNLNGNIAYFKFNRDNIDWYAVLYGSYSSSSAAKADISSLPKALQDPKPWMRRFSSVQKLIN